MYYVTLVLYMGKLSLYGIPFYPPVVFCPFLQGSVSIKVIMSIITYLLYNNFDLSSMSHYYLPDYIKWLISNNSHYFILLYSMVDLSNNAPLLSSCYITMVDLSNNSHYYHPVI